jgi:hypothetical protein
VGRVCFAHVVAGLLMQAQMQDQQRDSGRGRWAAGAAGAVCYGGVCLADEPMSLGQRFDSVRSETLCNAAQRWRVAGVCMACFRRRDKAWLAALHVVPSQEEEMGCGMMSKRRTSGQAAVKRRNGSEALTRGGGGGGGVVSGGSGSGSVVAVMVKVDACDGGAGGQQWRERARRWRERARV